MAKKTRVAVLYGGRSSEHEVSLQSAKCVLDNLDTKRFEVVPIAIDRDGRWHRHDFALLRASREKALPVSVADGGSGSELAQLSQGEGLTDAQGRAIDVVFPVVHGPLCEDGSLQGLLELADLPYVGSGVLGSAVCMDKDVAKRLARAAGLAVTEYVSLRSGELESQISALPERVAGELGFPVFVKPANLGSSVGVSRVREPGQLEAAVRTAFRYDTKILIERAVDAREIELAVLSSLDPLAPPDVSRPGEIIARDAFYDYERKYLDPEGAELRVPAALPPEVAEGARRIAATAFVALECEAMARVDLFLDRRGGELLFSEANTIPGFTTISMYPKLWEASGLPYGELLSRLIELALKRHARRSKLDRTR